MRYLESKEQSAEFLRLTLPLMVRQAAAYHPVSYTIWYEHVAGINPPLSTALTARLASNEPLTDEEAYRLYARHVSERDAAVLDNLQERLQSLLDDTAQTFNSAGEDTGHFSRTLRESRADLSGEATVAKIQQVISRLLSEALRMETMTQVLAEKLEGRTQEVKALTEQLQRAQTDAVVDPLCGIYNRRGFLREAKAMLESTSGLDGSALVLADVDHFKQINDTYGHPTGDDVLRNTARRIVSATRGTDLVARNGGDEFVMVLNHPVSPASASQILERLRADLSRPLGPPHPRIATTASIGLAYFPPQELPANASLLLTTADARMYESKSAGRNRVTTNRTPAQSATTTSGLPNPGSITQPARL